MRSVRGFLVALGLVAAFFFPPVLPLWLAVAFVRRRRAGKPGLPPLSLLTRTGRVAFFVVGWVGLTLVTLTFFAATISTSTDEHIAPVLAAFTILALFLVAAADTLAQATHWAARETLRRVGHQ